MGDGIGGYVHWVQGRRGCLLLGTEAQLRIN